MARCKECNAKFTPKYFNQKFCVDNDECLKALADYAKEVEFKRQNKDWQKRKTVMVSDAKTLPNIKDDLQKEINKLARMIDGDLPCISCGTVLPVQYAGGHRKSRGAHSNIQFHLDNVHKQCNSYCNKNLSGNIDGYDKGLIDRYGTIYHAKVISLSLEYPQLKLSKQELIDKIGVTRKLIRDFDTFNFDDPKKARNLCNKIIGIY